MATPKVQRIGIWVIAGTMLIGTVGSFAAMILQTKNDQTDRDSSAKAMEDQMRQYQERQKRAEDLSKTYYSQFRPYKDMVAAFEPTSGDQVTTKDLKAGDGAEITADTKYEAYYIGWLSDGTVFDSSLSDEGETLSAPLDTSEIPGIIDGWSKGVAGMKVGGVREITIPPTLGYGEKGSGSTIPANSSLKFIVMIIGTK